MPCFLELADEDVLPKQYDYYILLSNRFRNSIRWCSNTKKQYDIVPENWTDRVKAQHAIQYLDRIKKTLVEYAKEILNDYHKLNYSLSAWNILLGQWMNIFLSSYYDKYLKLKAVKGMGIDAETVC